MLRTLYFAFIYPYFNYGCIIWGQTYPTNLAKILTVQKRSVRTITFADRFTPSLPIFKGLNVLPFSYVVAYHTVIFMHDYYYGRLPSNMLQLFCLRSTVSSYTTRNTDSLSYDLPRIRTNFGKFSIRYQGPFFWNALPLDLKRIRSRELFKKRIKMFYLNQM